MSQGRRQLRITDEAREWLDKVQWVNKSKFAAKVVFGDDRIPVNIAESTAFRQPRETVIKRSDKIIAAVKKLLEVRF